MPSRFEVRARHAVVALHVRRSRDRLFDAAPYFRAIQNEPACREPMDMDGRHTLKLEGDNVDELERTATFLISCCDSHGRDATYADRTHFTRRHFPLKPNEGIGSSAHVVISLDHQAGMPNCHPAVIEEAAALHRSRIQDFFNKLFERNLASLITISHSSKSKAKKGEDSTLRIRFDVFNDEDLSKLADKINLSEVLIYGNSILDSEYYITEEKSLRFRMSPVSGIENMRRIVSRAVERAKIEIGGALRINMRVQRPDSTSTTIRALDENSDVFAEAFQKIDQLTGFRAPLKDAPEKIVTEIQQKIASVLLNRIAPRSKSQPAKTTEINVNVSRKARKIA